MKKLLLWLLLSSAPLVWAEDAPVYDVDSYPPQFDGNNNGNGAGATPAPGVNSDATQGMPPLASSPAGAPPVAGRSFSAGPGAAPTDLPPGGQNGAYPNSDFDQPVPAESRSFSPAANPNMSMEQRVARLENTVHADVSSKVAELQAEVQTLRGQIEEINHQLQMLGSSAKAGAGDSPLMASDNSADDASGGTGGASKAKKNKKTSNGSANPSVSKGLPTATSESSASANQPNVAEEQQIYQTAYNLIKAKKYNDAADTLQKMLQKYPTGQFAANAHYWLGELYSLMNKNDQSLAEFNNVVKNYPDSPKIADAQLKLGLINAAQQKWSEAKTAFKKVINRYPGTASAHLAAEQLKQLKLAGH